MNKILEKFDRAVQIFIVPVGIVFLYHQIIDGRYINAAISILILIIYSIIKEYEQETKI